MSFLVPNRADWCLPELVAQRGEELGDRPFLSFALGEREISYGEAAASARSIAGGLAAIGVQPGERVLMMMRNRAEFTLSMLGVAEAHCVQVPVNVDYRGPFLEHLVNTAEASTMIVEGELADAVAASLRNSLGTAFMAGLPRWPARSLAPTHRGRAPARSTRAPSPMRRGRRNGRHAPPA